MACSALRCSANFTELKRGGTKLKVDVLHIGSFRLSRSTSCVSFLPRLRPQCGYKSLIQFLSVGDYVFPPSPPCQQTNRRRGFTPYRSRAGIFIHFLVHPPIRRADSGKVCVWAHSLPLLLICIHGKLAFFTCLRKPFFKPRGERRGEKRRIINGNCK